MKKISVLIFSAATTALITYVGAMFNNSQNLAVASKSSTPGELTSSTQEVPVAPPVKDLTPEPKSEEKLNPEPKPFAYLVSIDRNHLSSSDLKHLEDTLNLGQVPPTAIGKECTFYNEPNMWCNVQKDEVKAKWVFDYLNTGVLKDKVKLQGVKKFGSGISNENRG